MLEGEGLDSWFHIKGKHVEFSGTRRFAPARHSRLVSQTFAS